MSNGNSNHKTKSYHFPTPLVITSNSKITVIAGKATLVHEGDLLLRIVDGQLIELKPLEKLTIESITTKQSVLINEPEEPILQFVIPSDHKFIFETEASRATYGGDKSTYQYYKRESDASYFVAIMQGEKVKQRYDLGSLFDQKSKIAIALKTFTREKPFYRRDLKPHFMPPSLRQGQLIKACLEILTKEGFLTTQKIPKGEQELDRYTRTQKMLP